MQCRRDDCTAPVVNGVPLCHHSQLPLCPESCGCVHNGLFATAPVDVRDEYVCHYCEHTVKAVDL